MHARHIVFAPPAAAAAAAIPRVPAAAHAHGHSHGHTHTAGALPVPVPAVADVCPPARLPAPVGSGGPVRAFTDAELLESPPPSPAAAASDPAAARSPGSRSRTASPPRWPPWQPPRRVRRSTHGSPA
jgi:hypothetical protein